VVQQLMRWGLPASVIIVVLLLGVFLWWPPDDPPDRNSDLGAALMGGAMSGGLIALTVVFLERRFAAEADERNLQLTLGMGDRFVGIDLRGRDLSGFYLTGKDFSGAKF
jgi:hypothetical protein